MKEQQATDYLVYINPPALKSVLDIGTLLLLLLLLQILLIIIILEHGHILIYKKE